MTTTTNHVQLKGNLGNDPEIKVFEDGGKIARLSVATNEEVFRNGEKTTTSQWHIVTAKGKLAEKVEAELKKGNFVSVEGKLVTRNYTDKNGQKKYVTEVAASEITLHKKEE